jgi:anti-sigma regulatory factor (Ser/Thr protein kinase)
MHRQSFEARMDALASALAFVEEACAAEGMGRPDVLRMVFIVEELFTNTVTHGHGGDCALPIDVALTVDDGQARLSYADSAPAHDPLAGIKGAPGTLATSISLRPVGGLGAYLVGHLIESARYRREDGRNVLELFLPLED